MECSGVVHEIFIRPRYVNDPIGTSDPTMQRRHILPMHTEQTLTLNEGSILLYGILSWRLLHQLVR